MQIAEIVQQDIDGLVQIHRSIESEKGSADEKFQDCLSSIDPSADPPKKRRRTMTWDIRFSGKSLNSYCLAKCRNFRYTYTLLFFITCCRLQKLSRVLSENEMEYQNVIHL